MEGLLQRRMHRQVERTKAIESLKATNDCLYQSLCQTQKLCEQEHIGRKAGGEESNEENCSNVVTEMLDILSQKDPLF